jgi:hypothetical protein
MPISRSINVRKIEVPDFTFVRDLAAQQPNFTIPPPYVLWLLSKVKSDGCLIAEHIERGPLGYLLAVPIEEPRGALYVWQLAVSTSNDSEDVILTLLRSLQEIVLRDHVNAIIFSARPNSPALRTIRRYARQMISAETIETKVLPEVVAPNECEYQVDIPDFLP